GLQHQSKGASLDVLDLARALLLGVGDVRVYGNRLARVQRGDEVRVTRSQQLDGLIVHHAAVIDGADTGSDGGLDAVGPVRMRGDVASPARRFLDRDVQLVLGVLLHAGRGCL